MKVKELIELLENIHEEDGNLEVMSSSNYGDYHNTEELNNIVEIIAAVPVDSAYSNTGLAIFPEHGNDDGREFDYEHTEQEMVIVLRYIN